MNNPTHTTLAAIHDAILAHVTGHWSGQENQLDTVAEYDPFDESAINSPAVLLNVEAMSYEERDGTGRTPVIMDMALHCILSKRTPRVQVEVREFAAELMRLVEQVGMSRWGLGEACGMPGNISAQPAAFSPDKGGFESWAVTWSQTFWIGGPDEEPYHLPDKLYASVEPELGPDYKPDYQQVTGFTE